MSAFVNSAAHFATRVALYELGKLARLTVEDVNRVIREHLSTADIKFVFVTPDGANAAPAGSTFFQEITAMNDEIKARAGTEIGASTGTEIDSSTRTEIEARVFRKMVEHLRAHPDVQNLDLMNLAYFCRNCLSKWYAGAAGEEGVALDYEQAREIVYGMPYAEYKRHHQREASPEQLEKFAVAEKKATP